MEAPERPAPGLGRLERPPASEAKTKHRANDKRQTRLRLPKRDFEKPAAYVKNFMFVTPLSTFIASLRLTANLFFVKELPHKQARTGAGRANPTSLHRTIVNGSHVVAVCAREMRY